ncbi:nucleotidyltransferase family protein [Rhizobium sp. NRK18]|uniref:nucleotidyltransferase family protein n=1 Tax=Rhizobium sp. NRK18 TaxID=2964667 RepID=UPI0021C317F8|nr:nucleotidyltransferase family protein [Rhizobium sp. NRK18]MCQ2005655.1 nucleotidyltransferase family protein [Rhizobium sp. NRK18]
MTHLRFAGAAPEEQTAALKDIILSEDWLVEALHRLDGMRLPDSWIVAGALYNMVWNRLTDRPSRHGIKDVDIFYFDDDDLTFEAEDYVIRRAAGVFSDMAVPAEVRNQARVHLWFGQHFGFDIEPIADCRDAVSRFSSVAYCVGARLDTAGDLQITAPYGLDDLFSFRIRPNRYYDNRETHERKAERAVSLWPEVTVEPW